METCKAISKNLMSEVVLKPSEENYCSKFQYSEEFNFRWETRHNSSLSKLRIESL